MESGFGFTTEMIRQLRKEMDHHRESAREHSQKADAVETMLKAAKTLAPEAFEEETEASLVETVQGVFDEHVSVPDAIRRVLREADRSMTKLGIRQRLVESGFPEERLGTNAAYFYTALRRMEKGGELRRRGKLYRLAD